MFKLAPVDIAILVAYLVSVAVVVVGTAVGCYAKSLNEIVQWIVAALYGGYTASNFLKWYWWRFNSYGYFWGMWNWYDKLEDYPADLATDLPDSATRG